MDAQTKKLIPWVLLALALIGAGVGLLHWVGRTETDLKAASPPSEKPMFLEGTPQAALYQYVESDFQGERLEAASWLKFKELVIWPNEPNWDHAYVISRYRVQAGPQSGHDASVEVTYDTLGELDTEVYTYEHSPSRQTVPFTMVPKKGVWKVGMPRLQPHPGAQATIDYLERMAVHYPRYKKNIDASIAAIRADAKLTEHP